MTAHDPMIANASLKDLVRMIEMDSNATCREIRLAKICGGDEYSREDWESRCDDAEDQLQDVQRDLEEAEEEIVDLRELLETILSEVANIPDEILTKIEKAIK